MHGWCAKFVFWCKGGAGVGLGKFLGFLWSVLDFPFWVLKRWFSGVDFFLLGEIQGFEWLNLGEILGLLG